MVHNSREYIIMIIAKRSWKEDLQPYCCLCHWRYVCKYTCLYVSKSTQRAAQYVFFLVPYPSVGKAWTAFSYSCIFPIDSWFSTWNQIYIYFFSHQVGQVQIVGVKNRIGSFWLKITISQSFERKFDYLGLWSL